METNESVEIFQGKGYTGILLRPRPAKGRYLSGRGLNTYANGILDTNVIIVIAITKLSNYLIFFNVRKICQSRQDKLCDMLMMIGYYQSKFNRTHLVILSTIMSHATPSALSLLTKIEYLVKVCVL